MAAQSCNTQRSNEHGFSLLEFAIVVLIVAGVVYALLPHVSDGIKLAHETVVRQTTTAFRDSLRLVSLKHQALMTQQAVYDLRGAGNGELDLNVHGYPIGTGWRAGDARSLHTRDCEALWYGMLGGVPPSAAVSGDSDFRVQTGFDAQHGLGCHYRYRRAGQMAIHYFPDDGTLSADDRF
jgi:type II secretory pathway pseudopilin PulG